MSTITPTYPNIIRTRRVLLIGLITILILVSIALIAGSISAIISSTILDGYKADRIPVVRNLVIPISVPTPPTVNI